MIGENVTENQYASFSENSDVARMENNDYGYGAFPR
jgi:hypothetical protein